MADSGIQFPNDFLWGAATSSYQVEGRGDGRGESIWDVFCRTPGRVYANHNGDVACDQYHRYQEDVRLMHDIGIQAYRFSIAWPRIQPTGQGAVNQKGIDYYRRLAEELLAHNITPVATLYHWDLPAALQDQGGWTERDIVYRFQEYSEICFKQLSDVVSMWITLNEPWCVAALGYGMGQHAPGHRSVPEMVRAIHHLNMAHGLAVQCARGYGEPSVGTTLNIGVPRPATRRPEDVAHADRCADDARMYLWPLFGRGYPQRYVDHLEQQGAPLPLKAGDMEQIAQPLDFLGFNYYMEFVVAHTPPVNTTSAPTHHHAPPSYDPHFQPRWEDTTDMGWNITPTGFYRHLRWIRDEVGDIPLYITENGCAAPDIPTADKRVHDVMRINYLRSHLQQLSRAHADGINVRGYFVWSLLDNFEWGFGYSKRFGIIYCDYTTLERIPKDSYYFYRDCIAGYAE